MKNLFILLFIFLSINLIANELQWVDEQIEAIKPPRSAISKARIDAVKDPFIFLRKTVKKQKKNVAVSPIKKAPTKKIATKKVNKVSKTVVSYTLNAIINKSALINKKWYTVGSKVGKYTLSSVDNQSVILSYKKKKVLLSTQSKTKKLKFKNN